MSIAIDGDGLPLVTPPCMKTWATTLARRGVDAETIRDTMRAWADDAATEAIEWAVAYDAREAANP